MNELPKAVLDEYVKQAAETDEGGAIEVRSTKREKGGGVILWGDHVTLRWRVVWGGS